MTEDDRRTLFKAIGSKRYGPPSTWPVKDRPEGWHLEEPCTPHDAAMHDNGINDALLAINEIARS